LKTCGKVAGPMGEDGWRIASAAVPRTENPGPRAHSPEPRTQNPVPPLVHM